MSRLQLKVTHRTKTWGDFNLKAERINRSQYLDSEDVRIICKDSKAIIVKMLQQAITNTLETNEIFFLFFSFGLRKK